MTRGILTLAAAAAAFAAPTLASANCFPPKSFSQIGTQFSQYVLLPENAEASTLSVIGRFWQPGWRVSTNEGSCDETKWLTRCYDCTPEHDGAIYFVQGLLGQMQCFSGCPSNEMIVLIQDRIPNGGGIFAAGRVDEIPNGFPRFDFSRIEKDWTLVPIPKPHVVVSEIEGSTLRLGMTFADPINGYYGLDDAFPTETISAIHLLTFEGLAPPVNRSAWTPVARFMYQGGITTGSANLTGVCPGSEESIRFVAAALEFDNGQFLTDYVSAGVPVSCTVQVPGGAGRLPETGQGALGLARSGPDELTLTWGTACQATNPLYEVYQGVLGEWVDPIPLSCALNGTSYTVTAPPHDAYYLVVPYANRVRPPQVEGSYGLRSDGTERPPSTQACRTQYIVPCP